MAAGREPEGMRRRNYGFLVSKLAEQYRQWRREDPTRRERLSPYSTESTPPLGELDDERIEYYARQVSQRDAERSINMTNEALDRAKHRAGEAL